MNVGPRFEFVQITDIHIEDEGYQHWAIDTYSSCELLLRAAMAAHPTLDFVILSGDLVDKPTPGAYRRFMGLFKDIHVPVYRIPGNHDQETLFDEYLSARPFETAVQIALDGWRLILLNSSGPDHHSGHLSESELTRLRESVQDNDSHALIFVHHHPIPIGSVWMDAMGLDNAGDFRAIVESHSSRIKAVAFGHVHQEFEKIHNCVRYLGAPSTCVQFVPGSDKFERSALPPGYRWFSLKPGGKLETRVHYLDQWIQVTSSTKAALTR